MLNACTGLFTATETFIVLYNQQRLQPVTQRTTACFRNYILILHVILLITGLQVS